MPNSQKAQSNDSLAQEAVKGVFWVGGERVIRQVIGFIASLALARLLAPEDFGLLGMAIVFQGIAQLIADFGIGAAIVQEKKVTQTTLSSAFWVNLVVSISIAAILVVAAPWIAGFYENDLVAPIVMLMALNVVFGGLGTIPNTLLYKAMGFSVLAKIGALSSLTGAIVAVTMAWNGFGVWSLVAQPLTGSCVRVILLWMATRWFPDMVFSWISVRRLIHFSAGVMGSNLLNHANRNADDMLIGKFLGSGMLGYYSLAYQIMLYPLSQVAAVIVKVLFPTLSKIQDDPARMRRGYLKAVSAIAVVTFPMMLGLLAVSHEFIIVVFGEKWLPMEQVLQIFCILGIFQSIGTTVGTIYLSMGRTKLMFYITLAATPFLIGSFVIGLQWGIEGVAAAYALVSLSIFYISLHLAFRLIKLRMMEFHQSIIRPFAAAVIMYALVAFLSELLVFGYNPAVRLMLLVSIGVLSYGGISLIINRKQLSDIVLLIRNEMQRA